jgi:hypothetical protein
MFGMLYDEEEVEDTNRIVLKPGMRSRATRFSEVSIDGVTQYLIERLLECIIINIIDKPTNAAIVLAHPTVRFGICYHIEARRVQ